MSEENYANIYIKSEPSGEISLGKLNEEEISQIKELFKSDSFKDSDFIQSPYDYDSIGHTYGVSTLKDGSELDGYLTQPSYNTHSKISVPDCDDGFYLAYTSLSKVSIDFEFATNDGEVFDPQKMTFDTTDIDLGDVSDDLYGNINFSIIDGYQYNNETIEESEDAELEDRGYDREITIFQIHNGDFSLVYKNRNYDEEEWGEIIPV